MIRILIADDHDVVRSGLRELLETQPNWQVVGEASNGKEAVSKAVETKPDVAVIDYSLPMLNGLDVTRQIREHVPKTEILVFTMHDNDALIQEALNEFLEIVSRNKTYKDEAARKAMVALFSVVGERSDLANQYRRKLASVLY